MRSALLLVFALALLSGRALAQDPPTCSDETTSGMRRCLAALRDQLESQLTRALEGARDRALQPAHLDNAQVRWAAFRQDQCRAEASQFEGGSLQPVVFLGCRNKLTRLRIAYLAELFVDP